MIWIRIILLLVTENLLLNCSEIIKVETKVMVSVNGLGPGVIPYGLYKSQGVRED